MSSTTVAYIFQYSGIAGYLTSHWPRHFLHSLSTWDRPSPMTQTTLAYFRLVAKRQQCWHLHREGCSYPWAPRKESPQPQGRPGPTTLVVVAPVPKCEHHQPHHHRRRFQLRPHHHEHLFRAWPTKRSNERYTRKESEGVTGHNQSSGMISAASCRSLHTFIL